MPSEFRAVVAALGLDFRVYNYGHGGWDIIYHLYYLIHIFLFMFFNIGIAIRMEDFYEVLSSIL